MECHHYSANGFGQLLGMMFYSCASLPQYRLYDIPPSINRTFITLIPKVKSPTRVTEYRPIAPCNILCRLISKALANRLKKILPSVISESRNAFQSNKSILDNILVTFKALHHMKIQKSKNVGFMAMKLDMSKAYNRVYWKFLMKTMEKMDFCDK